MGEAKQADVCLTVNSWLVEWLDENHGIKSHLLPNGVDLQACDRALAERFIANYGHSDFVLFVGSIAGVKNPLAFVQAAKMLPKRVFLMIGSDLTKSNMEKAFGIALPKNLVALGALPHSLTLDAIAACTALVMTSHREGLPTALLEAMAMKKPCIVPDAPWFLDVIQSGKHGLKYEQGNLDDLVKKIETALGAGVFTGARVQIEKRFSWQVIIAQLDKVYGRLLDCNFPMPCLSSGEERLQNSY